MAKSEYRKRKRANKYDEKVAINASFEDVIKIALNMKPDINSVRPKKGKIKLSELKNEYPTSDDGGVFLQMIDANAIRVIGIANNCKVIVSFTFGNVTIGKIARNFGGDNKFDKTIEFPLLEGIGFITLTIEKEKKEINSYSAEIAFELLTVST